MSCALEEASDDRDGDSRQTTLSSAGYSDIEIEAVSPAITPGGGGSLADSVGFLLGTGIARALLDGAERGARRHALDAVTTALADYYKPGQGVVLGTGAWLVSAARRL